MPTLFTSYYEKQYKAPCCSFSSLCTLIIYSIAILVPFLFCFSSGGKLIIQVKKGFNYGLVFLAFECL